MTPLLEPSLLNICYSSIKLSSILRLLWEQEIGSSNLSTPTPENTSFPWRRAPFYDGALAFHIECHHLYYLSHTLSFIIKYTPLKDVKLKDVTPLAVYLVQSCVAYSTKIQYVNRNKRGVGLRRMPSTDFLNNFWFGGVYAPSSPTLVGFFCLWDDW